MDTFIEVHSYRTDWPRKSPTVIIFDVNPLEEYQTRSIIIIDNISILIDIINLLINTPETYNNSSDPHYNPAISHHNQAFHRLYVNLSYGWL